MFSLIDSCSNMETKNRQKNRLDLENLSFFLKKTFLKRWNMIFKRGDMNKLKYKTRLITKQIETTTTTTMKNRAYRKPKTKQNKTPL